jgi:hypothetical protein
MSASTVLEIAMGLIFIYLLLSIVCSAVQEWLGSLLDRRPKSLERGVRALFNDAKGMDLAARFYGHPIIRSLLPDAKKPSYISAETFSTVVLDLLSATPKLDGAIGVLVKQAAGDAQKLRQSLEQWFGTAMDRVSGLYKRWTQLALMAIALAVAVGGDVDSLSIARRLSRDPALRDQVVKAAQDYVASHPSESLKNAPDASKAFNAADKELEQVGFPLGWSSWDDFRGSFHEHFFAKLAGLILTAIAVSLGAPFWFDLLSKLVNLRLAGTKPARSD